MAYSRKYSKNGHNMKTPLITSRDDWTQPQLAEIYKHIEHIGTSDLGLNIYPNQFEIISAEKMIDAYASVGLPINYHHWSFGKQFMSDMAKYKTGRMGLAMEIVINSNPCISYLMEENNAITQALVMAHAAVGHNYVFKNNYLFKEWTNAGAIIDYMSFARDYILECEERYGEDEVERVLDAAHSLAAHGIDKRKRLHVPKMSEEQAATRAADEWAEEQLHLDIILKKTTHSDVRPAQCESSEELLDEENLLYYIYKYSPSLPQWKRELLRIVHKIRQYFYPQGQTKVLNEGMATFTHFYIMDELEKQGLISEDAQLAWLHLHSSVIYQPDFTSRHYDGSFNPYALGFAILKDVRRICTDPTPEDAEWFPDIVGTDWRSTIRSAVEGYRDESFIEQFLSPHLMRQLRMFSVEYVKNKGTVTQISDSIGWAELRRELAQSYNPINHVPEIVVRGARLQGDRTLTLEYRPFRGRGLYKPYMQRTLEHARSLWGYDVQLVTAAER
jgi:stage V sporulation protein R